MSTTSAAPGHTGSTNTALRLWPGIALLLVQWTARFLVPLVQPDLLGPAILTSMVCGVLIFLWWAFLSRAPGVERWGGVILIFGALVLVKQLVDKSIATGMMGFMYPIYTIPAMSLALVAWAVITQAWAPRPRRIALVVAVLLAAGMWLLVRTNGVTGDSRHDWAWRWAPTAEEILLAKQPILEAPTPPATTDTEAAASAEPSVEADTAAQAETEEEATADVAPQEPASEASGIAATTAEGTPSEAKTTAWPGFRGPHRDGIVHGVRLAIDWNAHPPEQLWRRPIGPGWSSFAVQDGLLYTQEQRGEDELVSAYDITTGEPVWQHADRARFWETQGGAGPRATPTLHAGRVYTFGATGILNALDAETGTLLWTRNAAQDMDAQVPPWGFSSSPLIVGDLVLVDARGLIAYQSDTGQLAWQGTSVPVSYSSPHLATLGGTEQILLLDGHGIVSFAPDGKELWRHEWDGFSMTQPAFPNDGGLLIGAGQGVGMRRLNVRQDGATWNVEASYDSIRLKPYFNDLVLHNGHAYGFDGSILAAMDVTDGSRKWKGGRYGHGQLLLLADQDVLLVLTEAGELALVAAKPDQFTQLARVPAIEGKTWNHPVLVGDLLLVRNGEQMAAFRVALASR